MTYTIKTDAISADYDAATLDEAARRFAAEEGIRGVSGAASLRAQVEKVGGWCHFFDQTGLSL